MRNTVKHIFFSLLIFTVGFVLQQTVVPLNTINSSPLDSRTPCQQASNGNIANHSGDVVPLFDNDSETNTDNAQSRITTSCNSLLNMLPTANSFSFSMEEKPTNIGFYNAVLSSQIFVFQEPDPPRLS